MDQLVNTLRGLDQDQAIVALFALILVGSFVVIGAAAIMNSMGKGGRMALFFGVAAVVVVWILVR